MNSLYPLKFNPIVKEKIWGGKKLQQILNKNTGNTQKAGESWEISGLQEDLSVVSNGFLKNNDIEELIEVYMGDLVGDRIYEKFGTEFPLLVKFIEANDFLSIQVHPDNETAKQRHNANGKTEMWYIVDADKDSELIIGFNQEMDKPKFVKAFGSGSLPEVLNFEKVSPKDVFYLPAGRIHATGPGILFAEIQQTSDITYRVFDWDRVDDEGNSRDLHIDLAVESLDYSHEKNYKTAYETKVNESSKIVESPYFTCNKIDLAAKIEKDFNWLDSFIIYMAVENDFKLWYNNSEEFITVTKGETILVPAIIKNFYLEPANSMAEILEVYISD